MNFLDINTGRTTKEMLFHIILLVLIVLTVLSFFVHSLMPPEISGAEIDSAAGAVDSVVPESSSIGSFIISNLSSIAHLVEYGLLGAELSLYVFFFTNKRMQASIVFFGCVHIIALIDETLQLFSGRVADVVDIWLDIIGYTVMFAIGFGALLAVKKIRNKDIKNG